MNFKIRSFALLLAPLLIFSAGNQARAESEETCNSVTCTEAEQNAPVMGAGVETDWDERPNVDDSYAIFSLPAFDSSWGLRRELYEKAADYYTSQRSRISNSRYLTIIDMAEHSSKKRFFLFDLSTGKVDRHNVSHGAGSDPDKDGFATLFSNTNDSHQTSLGFYVTLGTYQGSNGYSMRLRGLQSTNDNAERRAIVVHQANYVSDSKSKAGLSWGCPALDPKVSKKIIDRIKGGSLLLIDR